MARFDIRSHRWNRGHAKFCRNGARRRILLPVRGGRLPSRVGESPAPAKLSPQLAGLVAACFRLPRNSLPWVELIMHPTGRHFLQIPGPTNVPDRILRAMAQPTIDHRGPEFAALGRVVLEGLRAVFQTSGPVI